MRVDCQCFPFYSTKIAYQTVSSKLKRKAFLLQLGTFDLLNNLAEKHLVGAVETGLTTCYALV